MKAFNINHTMYVQITEEGFEHMKNTVGHEYIKHCITPYRTQINGEDWYRLQCWSAFDLMPPNFGGTPPFKTNVLFEDSDLIDSNK